VRDPQRRLTAVVARRGPETRSSAAEPGWALRWQDRAFLGRRAPGDLPSPRASARPAARRLKGSGSSSRLSSSKTAPSGPNPDSTAIASLRSAAAVALSRSRCRSSVRDQTASRRSTRGASTLVAALRTAAPAAGPPDSASSTKQLRGRIIGGRPAGRHRVEDHPRRSHLEERRQVGQRLAPGDLNRPNTAAPRALSSAHLFFCQHSAAAEGPIVPPGSSRVAVVCLRVAAR